VLVDGDRALLDLLGVAMVGVVLAQGYVGAVKGALTLRTGQCIDAALVTGYYAHLLRLPQRFFDTMRVGEITSRVNDAVKIRAFVNDVALDLAVSGIVVVSSVAAIALYSPPLALVAGAAAPAYAAVYQVANALNRRNQRRVMERAADLEAQLVESVGAMATVKRLGLEWFAELRTETRVVRLLRGVLASSRTALLAGGAADAVSRLTTVALLWVGAREVLDQRLSPGALISCYALLAYLTGPVGRLVGVNRAAQDALIAADRLFEIMDLEREDAAPRIDLAGAAEGGVRFERLSARYGARGRVLHEVTFDAPAGALTAVVGESGSGKSTLLAMLHRVYPADGGRVCVGGYDVAHLSLASLRRAVGVVPQRVDLFAGSLLENIALGDFEPDVRRVAELCRALGLLDFVSALPNGFHTPLGEQGATLSGGQRQRVAIARALYRTPAVLALDEATAALDSVAEQHVQGVARELVREGRTVLVIAHRLSTVVHADNIVVLDAGRVADQGGHAALLARGGAYARLWAHQFQLPPPASAVA
jgi:ATP-binding cassette subfamily B protein